MSTQPYASPNTFAEWITFSRAVHAAATRLQTIKDNQAWALALTVGIPRDGCCLHNASIDDAGTGWCAGPDGRQRLKVAKRAAHMLRANWEISRRADRISQRAFDRVNKNRSAA